MSQERTGRELVYRGAQGGGKTEALRKAAFENEARMVFYAGGPPNRVPTREMSFRNWVCTRFAIPPEHLKMD